VPAAREIDDIVSVMRLTNDPARARRGPDRFAFDL